MPPLWWVFVCAAGCGRSDAEVVAAAYAAPDFDTAKALCGTLAGEVAERCVVDVAAQHDRREVADCGDLRLPLWRDECVFRLAERLARAGDATRAVEHCAATRFARECSYHLLREVARGVPPGDVGAATGALAPWRELPTVADAPRLFWKAWFREGRAGGAALRPDDCAESACEQAARETLYESLRALHRADPTGYCAAPPSGASGWSDTPRVQEWAAAWSADACARDARPPPRAIPPPP